MKKIISLLFVSAFLFLAASCRSFSERTAANERKVLVERLDEALIRAGNYLIGRQASDGAWRSETYGCFRKGPELTGYVLSCLYFLPREVSEKTVAYRRGADYLAGFVDERGKIAVETGDLLFPAYSAANAGRAVALQDKSERNLRAQKAWLDVLLKHRLCGDLGWLPSDPEYGGWGFSVLPPRKPPAGTPRAPFCESNLSATVFGIAALRSAKVPTDHPAYREALMFVLRCQNYTDGEERQDLRFDDGGFFFMPGDEVQNKAGVAGMDRLGQRRFHSYGTMTADGVRCLIRCGLPADHPRVVAARRWLERNFSVKENPGRFEKDREVLRQATYYYWVWAATHALQAFGTREITVGTDEVETVWAEALAKELLARQEQNGSWVNRVCTDAKEDDPLVAVPWAAAALAVCRAGLESTENIASCKTR